MTQNRVDWSDHRISPAVYEDMVAVLISHLHLEAQRIDGSGGDGGRDVQLPLLTGLEIFELKSFTGRMTRQRRRQVEKSLARAAKHDPKAWHLVVPINHNPNELQWFMRITDPYPFACDWLGLDWLDKHIADHPSLPRYYIEGSADEIVRTLIELNREQAYLAGGLPDAIARINALAKRLNELDPHYAFALSSSPIDGTKVAVIPRYPGAEKDRQIRVSAAFNFPDTDEGRASASALRDTIAYGTPSDIAEEFVTSVAVEGISGLEKALGTARLAFGPGQNLAATEMPEMALRLTRANGAIAFQLPLKPTGRTVGTQGGEVTLTDYAEVVDVTMRLDAPSRRFTLNYHFSAPDKVLPGTLVPAMRFLTGLDSGLFASVLINGESAGPPVASAHAFPADLNGYLQLAYDLDEIQRKSGVYFPMPTSLSADEQNAILVARQLLDGEVVNAEWTSSRMTIPVKSLDGLKSLAEGDGQEIWARVPYTLRLGDDEYPIGYVLRTHASARIPELPEIPRGAPSETEIAVTLVPGQDRTLRIKLISMDDLEAAGEEGK